MVYNKVEICGINTSTLKVLPEKEKQRLLKEAIEDTEKRLDSLKQADKQAKKQLDSGDLGQDKYDALQREIIETENKLKSLKTEFKTMDER